LFVTAQEGQSHVAQLLLDAGANMEAAKDTTTPLMIAAAKDHTQVVQKLLAGGAKVDAAGLNGVTALGIAAFTGRCKVAKMLLSAGANPKLRTNSHTMIYAAAFGKVDRDVVQLLLEAWGDKPPISAADLIAALKMAASYKHNALFAWLMKELRRMYPEEIKLLFEGTDPLRGEPALAIVLDEWTSDVSSLGEQQAATCKWEEDVVVDKQHVQHLVVGAAGMARQAELSLAGWKPIDGPQRAGSGRPIAKLEDLAVWMTLFLFAVSLLLYPIRILWLWLTYLLCAIPGLIVAVLKPLFTLAVTFMPLALVVLVGLGLKYLFFRVTRKLKQD
jgi:hypothetical protein